MNMGATGLVALISFTENLPIDSALGKSINPKDEFGAWHTAAMTNTILADIYDAFAAVHTKKGRKAQPYPRPKERHSIGSGAVPISEFWDWWNGEN